MQICDFKSIIYSSLCTLLFFCFRNLLCWEITVKGMWDVCDCNCCAAWNKRLGSQVTFQSQTPLRHLSPLGLKPMVRCRGLNALGFCLCSQPELWFTWKKKKTEMCCLFLLQVQVFDPLCSQGRTDLQHIYKVYTSSRAYFLHGGISVTGEVGGKCKKD